MLTAALLAMAGLVIDGGYALAARQEAAADAEQAARAGADAISRDSLRGGGPLHVDPAAATAAAHALPRRHAATTGSASVAGDAVTVTVRITRTTAILSAVGIDTLSATATATARGLTGIDRPEPDGRHHRKDHPMTPHPPTDCRTAHPSRTGRRSPAGLGALRARSSSLVVAPPLALRSRSSATPFPEQAVVGGQLTDAAVIGMLAAVVWARLGATDARRRWSRRSPRSAASGSRAGSRCAGPSSTSPATSSSPSRSCSPARQPRPGQAVPPRRRGRRDGGLPPAVRPDVEPSDVGSIGTRPRREPRSTSRAARVRARSAHTVDAGSDARPTRDASRQQDSGTPSKPPQGRHHDTLWDIAERHLGDGLRWKEIYELNRHRPQPDGHRLEVARLIHPGWRLLLPADAIGIPAAGHEAAAPDSAVARWSRAQSQGRRGDRSGRFDARPSRGVRPLRTAPAPMDVASSNIVRDRQTRPEETRFSPARQATDEDATVTDDDGRTTTRPPSPSAALTLGLSALAAAGLTAELARRRRRAQRLPAPRRTTPPTRDRTRHKPSGTCAPPTPRSPSPRSATLSARSPRTATPAGRSLPGRPRRPRQRHPPSSCRLGSDEPDPVGPFTATGPRTLEASPTIPHRGDAADDDPVDPYPALVSVGVADDAVVLVNLEAAGTLHIDGPADDAAEIACAMTAELGTSVLSANAELVLTGCPPELARLTDPGRTRRLAPRRRSALG